MNIKNYLKVDFDKLTKSEQRVHDFIYNNQEEVLNLTIDELANKCYTSRGTIDRFLKKININGFKELKIIISNSRDVSFDNIDDFIETLKRNKNKKTLIVGFGSSYISAQYLERRLSLLDYNVNAQNIAQIIGMKQKHDLVIFISNSGSTKHFEAILDTYKNCEKLAITAKNSNLSKQVDYYIDNKQKTEIKNLYEHDKQIHNIQIIEIIFDKLM